MEKSGKMECSKCGSANVSTSETEQGTTITCKACGHTELY